MSSALRFGYPLRVHRRPLLDLLSAYAGSWLDGDAVMMECMVSLRRAGADMVLTSAAPDIAERLQG